MISTQRRKNTNILKNSIFWLPIFIVLTISILGACSSSSAYTPSTTTSEISAQSQGDKNIDALVEALSSEASVSGDTEGTSTLVAEGGMADTVADISASHKASGVAIGGSADMSTSPVATDVVTTAAIETLISTSIETFIETSVETAAVSSEQSISAETSSGAFVETEVPQSSSISIDKDGVYTSKDEVAAYIHAYGQLPSNYITKKRATELGWVSEEGNLSDVLPGKSIGGSAFGNYEKLLPEAEGRKYYECDIDYTGGYRNAKRLVYSNDGLIYYTEDHYNTFERLY